MDFTRAVPFLESFGNVTVLDIRRVGGWVITQKEDEVKKYTLPRVETLLVSRQCQSIHIFTKMLIFPALRRLHVETDLCYIYYMSSRYRQHNRFYHSLGIWELVELHCAKLEFIELFRSHSDANFDYYAYAAVHRFAAEVGSLRQVYGSSLFPRLTTLVIPADTVGGVGPFHSVPSLRRVGLTVGQTRMHRLSGPSESDWDLFTEAWRQRGDIEYFRIYDQDGNGSVKFEQITSSSQFTANEGPRL
jgi:hypothetical protein